MSNSTLTTIFEGNQTWYGDFIVNETETVTIQNCNFIVENGLIYVNGTLNVINSTVWMRNVSSRYKNVNVYGNFTMTNSTILGKNLIICQRASNVMIVNSSSPTTCCISYTDNFNISNSDLRFINVYRGNVHLMDSSLFTMIFPMYTSATLFASNSSIDYMLLILCYKGDLEIKQGLIENLTIYYQPYSANFTIVNTFVNMWDVYCMEFEGKLTNSVIEILEFDINPTWLGNLTLTSGHVEYMELNSSCFPFIVKNSTVNEWRITAYANASIQLLNSKDVDLDVLESARISLLNSSILYLCAYEEFSGSILAMNTTINSLNIRFKDSSSNLVLKEGFHEFFSIYVPEHGCNITLVDSQVNHWRIDAWKNSTLFVFNSTLTAGLWCPYNLKVTMNSSCSVYNSDIEVIYCAGSTYYHYQSCLTIVNCTVKTLYAYDANVTAINSTIYMLITDPININLINSNIILTLDFPFNMSDEDSINCEIMEEFDPPLPENIQRFSNYVNITSAYQDYLEFQVKISYNETEVEQAGIGEDQLQIYYLDNSHVWRLCQTQGVNTIENYVWANVTCFSCFVLGFSNIHNIATIEVESPKNIIGQGYISQINVIVSNQGNFQESFSVTLYANSTIIQTYNITLENGKSATLTFTWNTTGFAKGNYTLWAYAWPVQGETAIEDNTFVDGWIIVSIAGDITSATPNIPDGLVNMMDIGYICKKFMTTPTSPNWDPNADINGDGIVNMQDIGIACKNFLKPDP